MLAIRHEMLDGPLVVIAENRFSVIASSFCGDNPSPVSIGNLKIITWVQTLVLVVTSVSLGP